MRTSIFWTLFIPLIIIANKEPISPKAFNEKLSNGLCFIENKGQIHDQNYRPRPDVLYSATARDMLVHIKNNGVSYQLHKVNNYKELEIGTKNLKPKIAYEKTIYRIDLNWLNANTDFTRSEDEATPEIKNYYLSHCTNGILNVRSYKGVTLNGLYNGIDLHYYEKDGDLKYDYIVAPDANYKQIQIEVNGADVTLNKDGSLLLKTPLGTVKEGQPIVYQNGVLLKSNWKLDKNILSFEIHNYNPGYQLIIDPLTRLWGTYYGGSGDDQGRSCITDGVGSVYLTGTTDSNSDIATIGSHQNILAGYFDLFLVKFTLGGSRQWCTYYGGEYSEFGAEVSLDNTGSVYLSGITQSTLGISTVNSHQQNFGGGIDVFMVKFNSSGIRQWATYYGGAGVDLGSAYSDALGNVYLTGLTNSTTDIATPGSHQLSYGGGPNDAFLVKFNSSGVRQWGTYYGGNDDDGANKVRTDASGNIYMVGFQTNSSSGIATIGSHQPNFGGGAFDAFLIKFNSLGVRQWGTYYGDSGSDKGYDVCVDNSSNIYISGITDSNNNIASPGAHQTSFGGGVNDVFLAKFNSSGIRQWGTYYGGTGIDSGVRSYLDNFGNIYLAGHSDSNTGIATPGSYQSSFGGGTADVFFTKFNTNGVRQWATYYGGNGYDAIGGICLDNNENIYLSGATDSSNDIANLTGYQPTFSGGTFDAFLVRFDNCPQLSPSVTVNSEVCLGAPINFSVSISGTSTPTYSWVGPNSFTSSLQNPVITNAGTVHVGTYTLTIYNNGCTDIANVQIMNVTPCTSLNEKVSVAVDLDLFPNPNNGKFTIRNSNDEAYTIHIYNQSGQLMYEEIFGGKIKEFDLSNFSKGVYYARINCNDKHRNLKVIVE
jgi:hypothetical protein